MQPSPENEPAASLKASLGPRKSKRCYGQHELVWDGLTLRLGSKRGRVLTTVEPDGKWSGMYRVRHDGRLTDMVNLTRARDAAISLLFRN